MPTRRRMHNIWLMIFAVSIGILFLTVNVAPAQVTATGIALPGNKIPQFVEPLPILSVAGGTMPIADGTLPVTLTMCEFQANVLPTGTKLAGQPLLAGQKPVTSVWGYVVGTTCPTAVRDTYLGPVILAQRGLSTQVTFYNKLGRGSTSNLGFWKTSTDQTLHWADPLNVEANQCAMDLVMGTAPAGPCGNNYVDLIPAVPHLHGGEIPPVLDGGPDAWFTDYPAPGGQVYSGHGYYTLGQAQGSQAPGNWAVYNYPNTQEAANIWFHDHALGITRLNVYAGLAGGYLIRDESVTLPTGLMPYGLGTAALPTYTVPMIIQDRMFDTAGQLFFPNIPINIEHPFWVPEFVGDTIAVNGKVWPYLSVDRKRYRFLFLNGSNARAYDMFLTDPVSGVKGPRMWVIGTDGGYLDTPVLIDPNTTNKAINKSLTIMPGERYDVIIDFNDPVWLQSLAAVGAATWPKNLILRNTAKTPFPNGAPAAQNTTGRVMQFRVTATVPATDNGFNPATPGVTIRGGVGQAPIIQRLVNTTTGTFIGTPAATRQLTLNEAMGAGGPLEVLVNNTKWTGLSMDTIRFPQGVRPDFWPHALKSITTYYSEQPFESTTELWEIINLTADAHPIHTHLTQVQLVNRQNFNVKNYNAAYAAAFPGGLLIDAFGPPADYTSGQTLVQQPDGTWAFTGPAVTTFLGGNPNVNPFLAGAVVPPLPFERGWKDTVIMYPGQVTRIAVRYAPTDTTAGATAWYPFNPDGGHGYVWHCHIIDHEDNEMMRPLSVTPTFVGTRPVINY